MPQRVSFIHSIFLGLRTTVFYFFMSVTLIIAVAILFVSCIGPFPFHYRFCVQVSWNKLCIFLLRIICGVRFRIKGLENLQHLPAVVLAKHQSAWETFFVPSIIYRIVVLYKQELLSVPVLSTAMKLLKYISIDRKDGKKALKKLLKEGNVRLEDRISVLIFPEGTRAPIGAHPEFFAGGALLAKKSGFPIIPVAYDSGKCWPKGFLKYPGMISVVIGEPIDSEGKSAKELNKLAHEWMKTTMDGLSG